MKRLNRRALRRMILNELTMLQDNTMKVVELSLGAGFTLRHPELQGGEIVVDEMDEVAGALVALKGMGFTHVHSLETGDEPEPIGATIQYFDDEIGGGRGRYKEYYPGSMNTYPVTTIIDDFDDDDDDFI
jgi:hypothetical protein